MNEIMEINVGERREGERREGERRKGKPTHPPPPTPDVKAGIWNSDFPIKVLSKPKLSLE